MAQYIKKLFCISFVFAVLCLSFFNAAAETVEYSASEFYYLVKGDKGEEVKALQTRLIELGYLKGKADGSFGKGTLNAFKEFEEANGLYADGEASGSDQVVLYSTGAVGADGLQYEAYKTQNGNPSPSPAWINSNYICNTNTKKFHWANCRWVKKMYDNHKLGVDNRNDAIAMGYIPCEVCDP